MSEVIIGRIVVATGPLDRHAALTLQRTLPTALAMLDPGPGGLRIGTLRVDLTATPLSAERIAGALDAAIAKAQRRRL